MRLDFGHDAAVVNYRERPDLYPVGAGDLLAEPYRSELLPLCHFETAAAALESAEELAFQYRRFKERGDFVGMDTVRKILQMGVIRSRRRAAPVAGRRIAGGRRPDAGAQSSAEAFRLKLEAVKADPDFARMRDQHVARHGEVKPAPAARPRALVLLAARRG